MKISGFGLNLISIYRKPNSIRKSVTDRDMFFSKTMSLSEYCDTTCFGTTCHSVLCFISGMINTDADMAAAL